LEHKGEAAALVQYIAKNDPRRFQLMQRAAGSMRISMTWSPIGTNSPVIGLRR